MTVPSRPDESFGLYDVVVKQVTLAIKEREILLVNLSAESGIAEGKLSSILDGECREVTLRDLAGLSLALGISLAALLTDS